MKITKQQLINMNACARGLNRFIEQAGDTNEPVEVASLIGGLNTYEDLLWLAKKTKTRAGIVRFAKDCALINIELIKPYTDDYDLIVDFLTSDDDVCDAIYEVVSTAYGAARDDYTAHDAADAAYSAVYAADADYDIDSVIDSVVDTIEAVCSIDPSNIGRADELLKGLLS